MAKKQHGDDEHYEWHRQAHAGALRAWRQHLHDLADAARAGDEEARETLRHEAARGDADARRLLSALDGDDKK